MIECSRKGMEQFHSRNNDVQFRTSYERSHYYRVPLIHPLYRARVNIKLPEDPVKDLSLNNYTSVYNKVYDIKHIGYQPEHYGRLQLRNPTLKPLHEKYVQCLVKSTIEPGLTVSGLTYVPPKKLFEPLSLSHNAPVDDATCQITAHGRDEFPPIPPNEPGFHKHLDIFVSTTHMTHVNFTNDQRNGILNEEAITYYNTGSVTEHRGTGSKTILRTGPCVSQGGDTVSYSVYPRTCRVVPYKGNTSTFKTDYRRPPRYPTFCRPNVRFPSVFKLSRNEVLVTPAMYRTEQSHVGGIHQFRGS